jgi:hypothetical protein
MIPRRYPYNEEEQMYPYSLAGQSYPYFNSFNTPIIQETPETILARVDPKKTFRLLEDMSVRRFNTELNEIGCSVINTYLNRLNSEDTSGLKECEFHEVKRRNLLGFVTERGMRFKFRR